MTTPLLSTELPRFVAPAGRIDRRGSDVTDISSGTRSVDRDASFARFYEENRDNVARALSVTLRNPELAAEATDEAMTRAYQRWSKVSGYEKPAGWVYRVGLNWSRSWLRKRARDRPWRLGEDSQAPLERDDSFDAALAKLSVDHRAVVACRIYLDWSVEQTAEALEIAPGTVKSRLARAVAQLEKHLNVPPPGENR